MIKMPSGFLAHGEQVSGWAFFHLSTCFFSVEVLYL